MTSNQLDELVDAINEVNDDKSYGLHSYRPGSHRLYRLFRVDFSPSRPMTTLTEFFPYREMLRYLEGFSVGMVAHEELSDPYSVYDSSVKELKNGEKIS